MTVRAGMEHLITRLRGLTEAGTADYTLAGVSYWSDDQMQDVLDRHGQPVWRQALTLGDWDQNSEYHDYYLPVKNAEGTASGTAVWRLEDANENLVGVAYTVNDESGLVRFTPDTEGSAYYVTTRTYNLNRAAAEVWETKAAHASKGYAFTADGATYNRQQVYEHCLRMADRYRNLSGVKVARLFRSDVA